MPKLPERDPASPKGTYYVSEVPDDLKDLEPNVGWNRYGDRGPSFAATLDRVSLGGPFAQFGVYEGRTARQYLEPAGRELWLFDSFEGLPEDWEKGVTTEPKGKYACRLPAFGDNVKIVAGWFEDTLPRFRKGEPFALIDIDCDLYSSTRTVLKEMNNRIVPGTVLRFDELISYPNWRDHEWRAFRYWCRKFEREVEWFDRGRVYWASCVVTR